MQNQHEPITARAWQNLFKLRQPCANCPFRQAGAITLAPGRLAQIIAWLSSDDHATFYCHKTVHGKRKGGQWRDDGRYVASGRESTCAGAMIYLEKLGRPSVAMRVGRVFGMYSPAALIPHFSEVIDPVTGTVTSARPGSRRHGTREHDGCES